MMASRGTLVVMDGYYGIVTGMSLMAGLYEVFLSNGLRVEVKGEALKVLPLKEGDKSESTSPASFQEILEWNTDGGFEKMTS